MPCPANPQPPGLFDGIPPQSASVFWGAIITAGMIGAIIVGSTVFVAWAYSKPRGSPVRQYLWMRIVAVLSLIIVLTIANIRYSWQDALFTWENSSLFQHCPTFQTAANAAMQQVSVLFDIQTGVFFVGLFVTFLPLLLAYRRSRHVQPPARWP